MTEADAIRPRWELVRCTNPTCAHEHARESTGRLALPCMRCGGPMVVLRLVPSLNETPPAPSEDSEFTVATMATALRSAARRCEELATDFARPARERATYTGRADAYRDAAEMADAVQAGARDLSEMVS